MANPVGINGHRKGPHELALERLRELVILAREAAARGDWTQNHLLCDQHDRLALELLRRGNG